MTDPSLTAGEASTLLGVSPCRVRQLAQRGQLDVVGVGPGVLVSRVSVEQRVLLSPGRGRPWSPGTAWAAAWLVDDREPGWLNERTLRRLRARVRGASRQALLAQLRPLARVSNWQAGAAQLDAIRVEAGTAWHRDSAGTMTVCLPETRADGLPGRYGLLAGGDLVVVATTGYRASTERYVPSLLLGQQ